MVYNNAALPFDRAHLSTFTGGDMALEREILEDFCINAKSHLVALTAAKGTPSWGEGAHRLKGASSGVGMRGFARLCAEAEALDIADTARAESLLGQMTQQLDDLIAYLTP